MPKHQIDFSLDPKNLTNDQLWDLHRIILEVSTLKCWSAASRALDCTTNPQDAKNMINMAFAHLSCTGQYRNDSVNHYFNITMSLLDNLLLQHQEQETPDVQAPKQEER